MDLDRVITTYTGHHLTRQQLRAAMQVGGLAAELAMGIRSTAEAVRVIDMITRHTTAVRQAVGAEPGHPHPSLSGDDLQGAGVRFDALVAVRSQQLGHLDRLLRLWKLWLGEDEPEPGPQR